MPRLLHDIVRAVLTGLPDVELESTNLERRELREAGAVREADVVIVAEDDDARDHYIEMLYAHPRLRLVAISGHARAAFLYELRPHRVLLGELSPDALLHAVR